MLGNLGNPLKIAVIGSGPSGFYAAEALLKANIDVRVDMFDRLPTPYGLVRGGVAPDHQKIKSVIMVYDKVAALPAFRFFGNVKLGQDIQVDDLSKFYHMIVYAVGNETDRKLGISGEDIHGSYSATSFVGWYNSHPDYRNEQFDLSCERVAVVGIGNVAMDVTRILAEDPEKLATTDIAGYALDALRKSKVKEIYLLGRRGPAQAAFSPAEIHEIGELENADLVLDPKEAELDEVSKGEVLDINAKKNVEYLREHALKGEGSKSKKVRLRLCVSPVEILGKDGKITAVKLEKNKLVRDQKGSIAALGTGVFETISVDMVFRSVGYRGVPIAGVPFDQKSGRIPNVEGRVTDIQTKQPILGHYVVGWAKRGPSGLIGTNRADSQATVKNMLADIASVSETPLIPSSSKDVAPWLKDKDVQFVSFQDWKSLDKIELERGKANGKIREKFSRVSDMLSSVNQETPVL